MTLNLIAAVAENLAIGFQNKLIYWLPDDLKRFKALTTGHTIIMGRKTFESLPKGALPNRRNVVLTRRADATGLFPGCDVFASLEAALSSCAADEDVFVIGGESLYRAALPLAQKLYLTEVEDTPNEADAFFPPYRDRFRLVKEERHTKDERHQYDFTFSDYEAIS
ncbi:MAG: dihydrofolate reductase [Bacteroidaceae bacterium]|nr:dihydrofolate reductase [Bacteroidaceae bacterium]